MWYCMWTNEIDHPGKDHYYGEGVWAISKNIPAEQELNEKKYIVLSTVQILCLIKKLFYKPFQQK